MHNLSTVIRFEFVRTIKKKAFWFMAFGFPVIIAGVFAIVFFSNTATNKAAEELKNQSFSIGITDDSHLVNHGLITALKAKTFTTKQQGQQAVKDGKIDGYIYYPSDLSKQSIEVYGKDVGIFDNARYGGVADLLLKNSIQESINPSVRAVISGSVQTNLTTFRDGVVYEPAREMILPGIFLVMFYMLIAFFGGQMLTSTIEEKENRVMEMILTTIKARTLVVGKIISLVALALFQGLLIVIPAVTGYLILRDRLSLPDINLSSLPFDPMRMLTGATIFGLSFLLFTGLLVLIGSSVPTAKEAGQFMGLIMLLIFGPLYAVTLFISTPDTTIVRFLSLFPFTAPIPLLLRNAVGNLHGWEVALAIPILIVSTIIVMALAIRVFKYGALEYDRKVSIKEMFSRK